MLWPHWMKWDHPHDIMPTTWVATGYAAGMTLIKPWYYVINPVVEYDEYGSVLPWNE